MRFLATVKIHMSCEQFVHGLAAVWYCCSSRGALDSLFTGWPLLNNLAWQRPYFSVVTSPYYISNNELYSHRHNSVIHIGLYILRSVIHVLFHSSFLYLQKMTQVYDIEFPSYRHSGEKKVSQLKNAICELRKRVGCENCQNLNLMWFWPCIVVTMWK